MEAIVFALLVIALVGYGLERNHARQAGSARTVTRLAGSTDAIDRDTQRVLDELRAANR